MAWKAVYLVPVISLVRTSPLICPFDISTIMSSVAFVYNACNISIQIFGRNQFIFSNVLFQFAWYVHDHKFNVWQWLKKLRHTFEINVCCLIKIFSDNFYFCYDVCCDKQIIFVSHLMYICFDKWIKQHFSLQGYCNWSRQTR